MPKQQRLRPAVEVVWHEIRRIQKAFRINFYDDHPRKVEVKHMVSARSRYIGVDMETKVLQKADWKMLPGAWLPGQLLICHV